MPIKMPGDREFDETEKRKILFWIDIDKMNEDQTNELIERLQSQGVPRIPRAVARGFMLIAGGDVLQAM